MDTVKFCQCRLFICSLYLVWLLKQRKDATISIHTDPITSHTSKWWGVFSYSIYISFPLFHHLCHMKSVQHKVVFICHPILHLIGVSLSLPLSVCLNEARGPASLASSSFFPERQQHWSSAEASKWKSFWQHGVTTEKPTETTAQVGLSCPVLILLWFTLTASAGLRVTFQSKPRALSSTLMDVTELRVYGDTCLLLCKQRKRGATSMWVSGCLTCVQCWHPKHILHVLLLTSWKWKASEKWCTHQWGVLE